MRNESLVSKDQAISDAARIKAYFPFRIVYVATCLDGSFAGSGKTMARPRALARKGWEVEVLK